VFGNEKINMIDGMLLTQDLRPCTFALVLYFLLFLIQLKYSENKNGAFFRINDYFEISCHVVGKGKQFSESMKPLLLNYIVSISKLIDSTYPSISHTPLCVGNFILRKLYLFHLQRNIVWEKKDHDSL
jgi:hypothetical protein